MKKILLLTCLLIATNFAQTALPYFPSSLGHKWFFEVTPLDSLNKMVSGKTSFRIDSSSNAALYRGKNATFILSKSDTSYKVLSKVYTDTNYVDLSSGDGSEYYKLSSETKSTFDILAAKGIQGLPAIERSYENWYSLYRFSSAVNQTYSVFKNDTTITVSGTPVPLRFELKGMRVADKTITTKAGDFACKRFVLSYIVSYVVALPPMAIVLATFNDTISIAPGNWIVQSIVPASVLDLSLMSQGKTTIPGSVTSLIPESVIKNYNIGTPDSINAKYGPYASNQYNFWKARSSAPTPLVIYIHGGGFMGGGKAEVSQSFVNGLLAQGISVMSIDYRLTPDVIMPQHYMDCARAIQYARYHAKEFNIDPERIGSSGLSAGACTSFWLAFHNDMADASNPDPVLRMSTRLKGVACWSGQTSLDPRVVIDWCGPYAVQYLHDNTSVIGISPDSGATPSAYAKYELISPVNHLTSDDPPVWMYYTSVSTPTNQDQGIHYVGFGQHLKTKMDSLGIPCTLLTPANPVSDINSAIDFFVKNLSPGANGISADPITKKEFRLEQNYPNPFNPSTVIRYAVSRNEFVTIKMYDVTGNEIAVLVSEEKPAGKYNFTLNRGILEKLSSGVYFYRMTAGDFADTKKLLYLK